MRILAAIIYHLFSAICWLAYWLFMTFVWVFTCATVLLLLWEAYKAVVGHFWYCAGVLALVIGGVGICVFGFSLLYRLFEWAQERKDYP